ncbi:unnamed protein product [Closterium sp. NIES-53]
MHLLTEVDCGPKAWTILKELHAPTSIVATLMLERELSALRLSEGEPVQPVLDKMRDLYAKLATTGITYPEQTKFLKMLSLLPKSWLQFMSGLSLPQNQSLWTLEWVRTKILEEDFRRRQLRGGDDGSSGYGMQGSRRVRGRGFGSAGRGAKKENKSNNQQGGTGWGRGAKSGRGGKSSAGGKMKGSCWYCEKEGHPWFLCYKKPDGWTPQNHHQDGGAQRDQTNVANMVPDSSNNNSKSNGGAEKQERTAGQFFHIGEQGGQGDTSAKVGAELHPLDYWVLSTGAAWTMTPRKELLYVVRAALINEVCSASGHALNVARAGRAAFKGVDGKPVVLHVQGAAGQSGALGYAREQGCVQDPSRSGETDWATAHRRLGHVAMPLLKQMEKDGAVKGLKLNEQPPDDNCEIFGHVPKKYQMCVEEGEEAAAEGGERVQEAPAGGGGGVEASDSTSGAAGPKGEQQQGKAKAPTLSQRRKPKGVVMKGLETHVSSPGQTHIATMKLSAGADVAEQQLGNEEALLTLPHGYDPDEEDEPAYCFLAPAPEEPASMEEALAGPDREKWLVSMDAEYQSLLENGTWNLVVLPEGKKSVQCKWVLRIKTDDKGQVTIYKSRLVAKGFMQKEKKNYNEILADAAVTGKFIIHMDVSTAFLNGILEEDVYMTQPPRYEDGTGRVCENNCKRMNEKG